MRWTFPAGCALLASGAARAATISVTVAQDSRHRSTPPSSASAFSSQKRMSISRYIVVAVVRCSCAFCAVAGAPVELAEAEVAVGDEGAHAEVGGSRQRLLIGGLSLLDAGRVGLRGDLTEKPPRPRLGPALRLSARHLETRLPVLPSALQVS